jgi:hypothetical protein
LGSVHPIEPVTLTARTRQFFAQVETLVMFGFPRQDSTFLGRAFRTFFSPAAVFAFEHHIISRPTLTPFRARADYAWAKAGA